MHIPTCPGIAVSIYQSCFLSGAPEQVCRLFGSVVVVVVVIVPAAAIVAAAVVVVVFVVVVVVVAVFELPLICLTF